MEQLAEFGLNLIDYSYLLYFYLMLIQKKQEWKKAIIGILLISVIQFGKDQIFLFTILSKLIDVFLVTVFIFMYAKKYTLNYFFYALLIDAVFNFSITFFVSIAIEFGINIGQTLIFGPERILFALCLKIFVVFVLWITVRFLTRHHINDMRTERIMVTITIVTIFVFNYLLSKSETNTDILLYTILLTLVMITNFYVFYRYSRFIQIQFENKIIEQSINITSEYVTKIQQEQENIRKVRHDMKNQLSVLSILLNDKRYDEASKILADLFEAVDLNKTTISGNLFIDAILNQKMNEYKDIQFHLDIQITKDCVIDGKYIISLLSNIIDNACEELHRINENSFSLKLKGTQSQMIIVSKNKCRNEISFKTDKNKSEHGYGLKIIHEIANRYHGKVIKNIENGVFNISVLLLFGEEN